ncbi:MAG: hypothetical protein D6690_12525 [Nitrospirae bacterium]|nr:MAG: hypothetical protein D6690_12525 [Nitrospirota bacterium]
MEDVVREAMMVVSCFDMSVEHEKADVIASTQWILCCRKNAVGGLTRFGWDRRSKFASSFSSCERAHGIEHGIFVEY